MLQHWLSVQNQQKFGSDGDTNLSSLQHLPLVENLHGEHFISVFQFYDCDLQKEKKNKFEF